MTVKIAGLYMMDGVRNQRSLRAGRHVLFTLFPCPIELLDWFKEPEHFSFAHPHAHYCFFYGVDEDHVFRYLLALRIRKGPIATSNT